MWWRCWKCEKWYNPLAIYVPFTFVRLSVCLSVCLSVSSFSVCMYASPIRDALLHVWKRSKGIKVQSPLSVPVHCFSKDCTRVYVCTRYPIRSYSYGFPNSLINDPIKRTWEFRCSRLFDVDFLWCHPHSSSYIDDWGFKRAVSVKYCIFHEYICAIVSLLGWRAKLISREFTRIMNWLCSFQFFSDNLIHLCIGPYSFEKGWLINLVNSWWRHS